MAVPNSSNTTVKGETPGESPENATSMAQPSRWRRWLANRWLPVALILSVFVHAILLACWPAAVRAKQEVPAEIELGEFFFVNNEKNSRLDKARFQLHVSLLLGTENVGNKRLREKKFLVQQGIEELLRQSHAADFEDPTLAELKRQIQEKVNEAVELRTVDAVIITQLETQQRAPLAKTSLSGYESGGGRSELVSPVERVPDQATPSPAAVFPAEAIPAATSTVGYSPNAGQ